MNEIVHNRESVRITFDLSKITNTLLFNKNLLPIILIVWTMFSSVIPAFLYAWDIEYNANLQTDNWTYPINHSSNWPWNIWTFDWWNTPLQEEVYIGPLNQMQTEWTSTSIAIWKNANSGWVRIGAWASVWKVTVIRK